MALEQIVRPFQAPAPINTNTVVIDETLLPAQRARLQWSGVGTLPAPGINLSIKTCADKYKETSRNSSKVKVTNPDDDSQYVIVESVGEIFFQHQSTGSGEDDIFAQEMTAFNNATGIGELDLSFNVPDNCTSEYDLVSAYAGQTGG